MPKDWLDAEELRRALAAVNILFDLKIIDEGLFFTLIRKINEEAGK